MKRTQLVITDDLDGEAIEQDGHKMTTLCLDGEAVALDLSDAHQETLRGLLEPYLKAGHRVLSGHRRVVSVDELEAVAPTPQKKKRRSRAVAA